MAKLSIRIDIDDTRRIGPGKIALLESIAAHGSISAAGRAMDMSYKRAWDLIASLNGMFQEPVVSSQAGGKEGGGARLTTFGEELVAHYRAVENVTLEAAREHLRFIQKATKKTP